MTIGLLVCKASWQAAPGPGSSNQFAHLREFPSGLLSHFFRLSPMRHGIWGAGGVRGLIGAVLAHAGENVSLSVRPGTD
jgi:hypothetical protein